MEKELDKFSKELIYQMVGRKVVDIQDADYQIVYYYLHKAMNLKKS